MDALSLLARLHADGFSLAANGGQLIVRPASRLTDTVRTALRDAKSDLLALLAPEGSEPANPLLDPLAAAALAKLLIDRALRRAAVAEPGPDGYRIGIAVRTSNGGYATAVLYIPTLDAFAILGTLQCAGAKSYRKIEMTIPDSPITTPALVMGRPLPDWRLCDSCATDLERQRQSVGLAGAAVAYCSHRDLHATWHAGQFSVQLCASIEEAQRIDDGLARFLGQVQAVAYGTSDPDGKPN